VLKIARKILPLLTSKCSVSSKTNEAFELVYENVPCRIDGTGNDYVVNPDGAAKTNFTRHLVYMKKDGIDPAKVKRIWVTEGSIEDKARDLKVRQLVSNSDSAVFCFYAESAELRDESYINQTINS
jgi:hypothetical protein